MPMALTLNLCDFPVCLAFLPIFLCSADCIIYCNGAIWIENWVGCGCWCGCGGVGGANRKYLWLPSHRKYFAALHFIFCLFSFNLLPLSAQIAKRVIHLAGAVAGASGTNYLSRSGRNWKPRTETKVQKLNYWKLAKISALEGDSRRRQWVGTLNTLHAFRSWFIDFLLRYKVILMLLRADDLKLL